MMRSACRVRVADAGEYIPHLAWTIADGEDATLRAMLQGFAIGNRAPRRRS